MSGSCKEPRPATRGGYVGPVLLLLAACAHQAPHTPPPDPLVEARAAAAIADKDQVLDQLRLASQTLAAGNDEEADRTLRAAVQEMQDFAADGEFAAFVVSERSKQWKGEPWEKAMAFLQLGFLRLADGDPGNALAMSKSALLADTGSRQERWGSDLIAGFALQSLALADLGDSADAAAALERAIDAAWARGLSDALTRSLAAIPPGDDPAADHAARTLLLGGLPAGIAAHPRDPAAAVAGARSWATDARMTALDGPRKAWPPALGDLKRSAVRVAFEAMEPLAVAWAKAPIDPAILARIESDQAELRAALRPSSLLLVIEAGVGPTKQSRGKYDEQLVIVPGSGGRAPPVRLDGAPLLPAPLEDVSFQATTRGGRRVDAFLAGKAVFEDASLGVGYALAQAGNLASWSEGQQSDEVAAVLWIAAGVVWLAGAISSPAADTRQWGLLPDSLWLVRADPGPGVHALEVGDRHYTVEIPDRGRVVRYLPALDPGGANRFGTPCVHCEPAPSPALAIPAQ